MTPAQVDLNGWAAVLNATAALLPVVAGLQVWQLVAGWLRSRRRKHTEHRQQERDQRDAVIEAKLTEVTEQVKNSHTATNMRDDLDRLTGLVGTVVSLQGEQGETMRALLDDVRLIRHDQGRDRDNLAAHEEREQAARDRLQAEIIAACPARLHN